MHESKSEHNENYLRIQTRLGEEGAVYKASGDTVLFLDDRTTEQAFFDALTYTERQVAAARFRAWADMASYTGDEFVTEDDQ